MAAKNFVKLEAQNCDDSNMSSISNRSDNLSNCSDDDSSNISVGSRPNSPPASSLNQQAASTTTTAPIKRPRLNFSIESIMKSAGKLVHRAASSPKRSSSPHSNGSSGSSNNSGNMDNQAACGYDHKPERQEPDCNYQTSSPVSATNKRRSANKISNQNRNSDMESPPVCTDPRLAPFDCHLDNLDLWHRFHPLDTEMIITKQGRRMFPPVRVTFSLSAEMAAVLNPRDKYQVLMDILPYDKKRYRYAYHKSSWQQAGKADPPSPTKLFLHPDGPFTLEQLKRQVISFEKIKLTNNDANKHGMIVLNSMHKYQPRIHLVLWRGKESQNLANAPIAQLEDEIKKTFIFSETVFTAVTAYQNHSITKLKIDSNPFAKGFRDSSRLTDLELESMQDLISDGQCPFSPPRAPPPGFPHFLFAAAQAAQQQPSPSQKEDPATALLRERTLMSLDSFLHQQMQQQMHQQHLNQLNHQQQQQQQLPTSSLEPPPPLPYAPPTSQAGGSHQQDMLQLPPSSLAGGGQFGPFISQGPPLPHQTQLQGSNNPVTSAAGGGQQVFSSPPGAGLGNFEQLLMQQQHQFAAAAAMAAAAAAASGVHNSQQQLQALMAAHHHRQQMASLSMQFEHQQHSELNNNHQQIMSTAAATPSTNTTPATGGSASSTPTQAGIAKRSSAGSALTSLPKIGQVGSHLQAEPAIKRQRT